MIRLSRAVVATLTITLLGCGSAEPPALVRGLEGVGGDAALTTFQKRLDATFPDSTPETAMVYRLREQGFTVGPTLGCESSRCAEWRKWDGVGGQSWIVAWSVDKAGAVKRVQASGMLLN
jgi:hypothetical protein